jgi:hypothetical protein
LICGDRLSSGGVPDAQGCHSQGHGKMELRPVVGMLNALPGERDVFDFLKKCDK